ncbi:hypothetical protein H6F51_25380 [Cyanobacteria bacterium FACHB-DQ100]|nr:hypothetical protein [Cyanobacteria bacterium FACHB-DQ100]
MSTVFASKDELNSTHTIKGSDRGKYFASLLFADGVSVPLLGLKGMGDRYELR